MFNNADEPTLGVPTDQQSKEMPALMAEIEQSLKRLADGRRQLGRPAERVGSQARRQAGRELGPCWTRTARVAGGAAFSRLADGSLLAGGKIPAGDTYTVRAPVPGHAVTAVMLEALPRRVAARKGSWAWQAAAASS